VQKNIYFLVYFLQLLETFSVRALQSYRLGVDVPANTEAEDPTVLEDGNQETVNGPSRITVLVRRPMSTCQRVNEGTQMRKLRR
jgi:hypothetical protein